MKKITIEFDENGLNTQLVYLYFIVVWQFIILGYEPLKKY